MIDVSLSPGELVPDELSGRIAVVVDVLRATSTMVEALANGARAIYPVASIEAAQELASEIGGDGALLCGEREGLRIEGFDLGNSPREYSPERVGGKALVLTTTNGTPALLATTSARRTLVASFLNLSAVVAELVDSGSPVTVICSGREGRFSIDDVVCAGALVLGVLGPARRGADSASALGDLTDGARAAALIARASLGDLEGLYAESAAGQQLIDAGLGKDLEFCARLDRHRIVPRFHDGQVIL